jgi:hypothetical protein
LKEWIQLYEDIYSLLIFEKPFRKKGDSMKAKLGLSALTAIFVFLFFVSFLAVSGAAIPGKAEKESLLEAYGKLPLYFVENKGQLDSKVRFYVKTSGQTLYFTDEGIVFDLFRREKDTEKVMDGAENGHQTSGVKTERLVFNLAFENAQQAISIEGLGRRGARINYFVGNDKNKWKTGSPTFKGVVYKGVYVGIDLKVYGNGKDIEYEFIVTPGGNPDDILLTYNGIEGLATNGEGELLIATAFGELKETKPYIYQEVEGERVVDGNFEILSPAGQTQPGKFSYRFQVASYDPAYPLIIDPTLSYSTYLGGSDDDSGNGIAIDGSGNAYVTGNTYSTNFPTKNPYQGTKSGGSDVFITKLSSSGNTLSYSTYLGGSSGDYGQGIAVDGSGNAYVTGYTDSTNFPTKNPYQGNLSGPYDAFITKLSSSGSAFYSTYLGGSDDDSGNGIAIDGSGSAYVTGETTSTNFPMKNPYQIANSGLYDAFVTKLSDASYVSEDGNCGTKTPCYSKIQDAINVAANGSTILVKQGTYAESLSQGSAKMLLVKGGYNSTYNQQTSNTTFIEAPGPTNIKALSGSLTFQMVTIKP